MAEKVEFQKSGTVATAKRAVAKEEAKKVLNMADFNKAEEEKKKKAAEAAAQIEKKPVRKDGKFTCANKGCTNRYFLDEENKEDSCHFHSGGPVFHDLKKYWSCCPDAVTYEFEELPKIPTCSVGPHVKKVP